MEIANEKYDSLIGGQSVEFAAGVRDTLDAMTARSGVVAAHEDRFLPGVLEERGQAE
jgi:hypothetical protein